MIEEPDRCPFCGSHVPVVSDDPDHRWMGCACGFASAFRSKRQMLASERIAAALEAIAVRLDSITSATEGETHYLRTSEMR